MTTILVVEEVAVVRRAVRRHLEAAGYAVREATSNDEALTELGAHGEIAAILVDADGQESPPEPLARAVRAQRPDLMILAWATRPSPARLVSLSAAGVDNVVSRFALVSRLLPMLTARVPTS